MRIRKDERKTLLEKIEKCILSQKEPFILNRLVSAWYEQNKDKIMTSKPSIRVYFSQVCILLEKKGLIEITEIHEKNGAPSWKLRRVVRKRK